MTETDYPDSYDYDLVEEVLPEPIPPRRLHILVRAALVLVAVFLISGFALAVYLNPYKEDGEARRMETHRQLGLPQCTLYEKTGMPCPSCGMTSSFALFVRGDLWNSAKANWVGTILATFCLCLIPWSFASVYLNRPLFFGGIEIPISVSIVTMLSLLLLRWVIVLGLQYYTGMPPSP